jgi:2-polyprenyl-3-methyl-5-hydroxy-6-metoxy-1,4-benzoquinol methylase
MSNPNNYSSFYTNDKLGFDLVLVNEGFKQFKPHFVGESCLELGPATGYMTEMLVDCFKQVTVVEGSVELFNKIPDFDNITKHNCLFENFETTEKFDTIILNHVLEHIEFPDLLLNDIYSWLAEDGICIIGVPNAKSFHRLAAVKMGLLNTEYDLNQRDVELGHYRVYDLDLLKNQVNNAGFKILEEGGIFLKFLSNNQIEHLLDETTIDAYFKIANDFYYNSAEIYLVLQK